MTERFDGKACSELGIVADSTERADAVRSTVEHSATTVVSGDVSTVLDTDLDAVVAVGEPAVLDLVRAGVSTPILPVEAGRGIESVARGDVDAAVRRLVDGDWWTFERQLLSVSVDGNHVGPALMDVMLVTTEPARISEYGVATGEMRVSQFRADGVVVATPAGSHGYARNADGPLVAPEVDAATVVPVAPFAIDTDHWLLGLTDTITLTVERDESDVSLLVDDRDVRQVTVDEPVEITNGGNIQFVGVLERSSFFEGAR